MRRGQSAGIAQPAIKHRAGESYHEDNQQWIILAAGAAPEIVVEVAQHRREAGWTRIGYRVGRQVPCARNLRLLREYRKNPYHRQSNRERKDSPYDRFPPRRG